MELRRWQINAMEAALIKYRSGNSHFLCLATPGAGKTIMASSIARSLLQSGEIDLVFCFSPSINVASTFKSTLESILDCRLDGLLGSYGQVLTYQSMLNLGKQFWSLLNSQRVFVIFDEIHHCAGDQLGNSNAWGQKIIQFIQGRATFTLAMTGTPWRSDKIPIALSSYCHLGKVQCDFIYGIDQAIKDGVCRIPKITAIDNENIHVKNGDKTDNYFSFSDLLKKSGCNYQQLIENKDLIKYLIKLCVKKLDMVRTSNQDAGGLIVATSVDHAEMIADILLMECGEKAFIATYMHDDAQEVIQQFRNSLDKWIISVGMISEGTDIPRLKVCCHLTRVKTELYFRQVLGRILRNNNHIQEEAYLYMPAEPNLIEYAKRISEDIPEYNTVYFFKMSSTTLDLDVNEIVVNTTTDIELNTDECAIDIKDKLHLITQDTTPITRLSDTYDSSLDLFGRFKKRLISLSLING